MQKQVEIVLPTATPHGFDYLVPEGMQLEIGSLVTVPFGRGESLGVVWAEGAANLPAHKLKQILSVHQDVPPLSTPMREFIDWAAWYNGALKGMVLKMALPIKDIEKKGRLQASEFGVQSSDFRLATLSVQQKEAAHSIQEKIGAGFSVSVLDGITGSGKTEVYYEVIAQMLGRQSPVASHQKERAAGDRRLETGDSQILILLPEIALSVQSVARFEKRFGFTPVIWNSEITPARKRLAWQAIAKGEARVVIGARSALFLPYKNLSLIVVDEEHDASYKQEEGVIYHARDMAVARARFEKIPALLVSATPSLETYQNMQSGKYQELQLTDRHAGAQLPDIHMIDMRGVGETQRVVERGNFISNTLREKLAHNLAAGHQSMLFLNRRGYAPLVLCRHCGHRFECPECSTWLVMHKKGAGQSLQCHHCGYHGALPKECPACKTPDQLHACGPGVERIEDEVRDFLPQARVTVMASDMMHNVAAMEDAITQMSDRKIDILIGTQMIAKGHHFAGVSLVGVIDADLGLAGGDLRAAERTYQLLHQLSGRAGREEVAGTVYLQSFLPDHPVMQALLSGDRDAFFAAELEARRDAHMPPFSRLGALIVEGRKEEMVMKAAKQLAATFHSPLITLYGPAPAPLYRLRGLYRYRLLVKTDRNVNLSDYMAGWVKKTPVPSSIKVKIDIDPIGFL